MEESTPAKATPPTQTAAAPLPSVPDTWPGAKGVYKYSKQAVKINLLTIVAVYLFGVVVSAVLRSALKSVGGILSIVIDSLTTAAITITFLAGLKKQEISIGDSLSQAVPYWLRMIGLSLLIGVTALVSILLLIIPAFFVIPRLVLATYFLVDKNMDIMGAYKASWNATKGHVGKVYGILGINIAFVILMVTIIGIPFSIYFIVMYSAATAVLYKFLDKGAPAAANPTAPATAAPAAQ